jgi:hypothetical protein
MEICENPTWNFCKNKNTHALPFLSTLQTIFYYEIGIIKVGQK